MYKIHAPQITAAEAYRTTISAIRNPEKRNRHSTCASEVENKCEDYDRLGEQYLFETASPLSFGVPNLGSVAMQELYEKQFSKLTGTKQLRDVIRSGAENNLCPYCGIGLVSQLDHYLPKSEFHAVTVHPKNLVPSCADCNTAKKAFFPSSNTPAVFHPYFDIAFDIAWLDATLVRGHDGHPVALFDVHSKITDTQLRNRMTMHLDVFNLKNRFSSVASQSLQEFESVYRNSSQKLTLKEAKFELESNIRSRSSLRENDCRASTYRAMLTSAWYLIEFIQLD
ncbi:HNH endonuclease [Corynebacterium casei]|uniref:EA31 protein n=1 Tax=Corynebacterium casei LMG S-19264 TaxID=1285583 RepID=A0ABM5PNN2_9CORY|nr:HNH endonuclease signature motif containing protein [Corynebacterium casei]AHI19556.1 putative EA31 protein [Corynebacterium casei LMG S-19264]